MELTLDTLNALNEYVGLQRLWHDEQVREQKYADRMEGSSGANWTNDQDRVATQAFIDGAQVQEFNTDQAHRFLDVMDSLGGFEASLFGLGVTSYSIHVTDKWQNSYFNQPIAVWFTPTGEFYAGHIRGGTRVRIQAKDFKNSDTALEVFLYAVQGYYKTVMKARIDRWQDNSSRRTNNGAEPFSSWIEFEFSGHNESRVKSLVAEVDKYEAAE
jgi:hypothetical protein